MNAIPKTKVDILSITGKYPLLGLFLVVIEGLLGSWIFLAANTTERVVAGILMTMTFGGFLLALIQVSKEPEKKEKVIAPENLGEITPAKKEITKAEIDLREPQIIVAPDRSYIVDRPPDDWVIKEMTYSEWATQNLGITDPSIKAKLEGDPQQSQKVVLVLETINQTFIIPVPGKTKIGGRKFLTALTVNIPTRLAVFPLERTQPPLFSEQPLVHNFMNQVSQIQAIGLTPLRDFTSGVMEGNGRKFLMAEFCQNIENAIINGKEGKNIDSNITLIGVQGELTDYLFIMNYPSERSGQDAKINKDLETLRSLISSFRLTQILEPDKKRTEYQSNADKKFQETMTGAAKELFEQEFAIVLMRLGGLNMSNPDECLWAMKLIKPFELFAKEIDLQDEEAEELWHTLHEAEKGNSTAFSEAITGFIKMLREASQPKEQINNETIESSNEFTA